MSQRRTGAGLFSPEECSIYAAIARGDGLKARDIAKTLKLERSTVNSLLYASPLLQELCHKDGEERWHSLIRQSFPHDGLFEFAGYYSTVGEFVALGEADWLRRLQAGCSNIGRNLNDTRGLIHSFLDERAVLRRFFGDLQGFGVQGFEDWELVFEFRIKRSRYIRIYADVLVITPDTVFSLEFKMKDEILPEELQQALKYAAYLDLIFGAEYDVVPVLVLTGAEELYTLREVPGADAVVQVCAGDMLYNAADSALHFLA